MVVVVVVVVWMWVQLSDRARFDFQATMRKVRAQSRLHDRHHSTGCGSICREAQQKGRRRFRRPQRLTHHH